MDHIRRSDLPVFNMPGRTTNAAFGARGAVQTDECFMGYATFAPKYGTMESHCHEDEVMYVVDAKDAKVSFGPAKDQLNTTAKLEKGDVIRAADGEWHRFDFDSDDGFLDLIVFFTVPQPHTVNESDA